MNLKSDMELCAKYPKIFAGRHGDMRDTAMCWGFECRNGWYWVIDELCALIQNHIDNMERNRDAAIRYNEIIAQACVGNYIPFFEYYRSFDKDYVAEKLLKIATEEPRKVEKVWQVEAVQVKEKFGGLRFYVNGADETANAYIDFAESLSFRVCEYCGSTKDVSQTKTGWIKTLCQECMIKPKKEKE